MKKNKQLLIPKIFFMILFACLFIILSKAKLTPIFGTDTNFSASVFFGPIIARLIGIPFGIGAIFLAHIVGWALKLYTIKSALSLLVFMPILWGGIYFTRMFKGDKRLVLLPIVCMIAFILHPIGRTVWYYSLFWLIPIFITKFKKPIDKLLKREVLKIYSYSLGTAFVDHSVGSVIYLYFMKIPAKFWIMAMPFTIVERLIIAGGITFTYLAMRKPLEIMQKAFIAKAIAITKRQPQKEEVPVHV